MTAPTPPPRPAIRPGVCTHCAPPCGQPARLYPHGWLCTPAARRLAEARRKTP